MQEISFEERIQKLQSMLDNAKKIVFFGGAGVSTESGIPDFRSKDGLYNTPNVGFEAFTPEYLLSHDCLMRKSEVFYEFYRQKLDCRNIKPNITHLKLAEFEKNGRDIVVITQNIDNLHQKAGSKNVLEVHGSTDRNFCTACGEKFSGDFIFDSKEAVPKCPKCGRGIIRPEVTLYGEQLPMAFFEAEECCHKADLMIVAGTSLTVYPAANLVSEFYGKNLVIINRDPTDKDYLAELVFHENMGEVFSRLK